MNIILNGERRGVEGPVNLQELLSRIQVSGTDGIAVLVNGEVARRGSWPTTPVNSDDEIEIVRATVGG